MAFVIPLVMALASKKLQDDEQKRAYMHQLDQNEAATKMSIDARRASRAGDSGYMQAAMSGAAGYPQMGPSQNGPFIAGVASALMKQRDAPAAASAATANAPSMPTQYNSYQAASKPILANDVPNLYDEEQYA